MRGAGWWIAVALSQACGGAPPSTSGVHEEPLVLAPQKSSPLDAIAMRDEVVARGPLTKESVAAVMRAQSSGVVRCFEDALERDPKLAGEAIVTFSIAPNGTLAGPMELEGTLADFPAAKCARARLEEVTFDRAEGATSVRYRLEATGAYESRAEYTPEMVTRMAKLDIDVSSLDARVADTSTFTTTLEDMTPELVRCFKDPDPTRPQAIWEVGRVERDGSISLNALQAGASDVAAAHCIRAKLGRLRLQGVTTELALSLAARGPVAPKPVSATDDSGAISVLGGLTGDSIGESYGFGGLGLRGSGTGAGGVGTAGGIGTGAGGIGLGTSGAQGTGSGFGRLTSDRGSPVSIRMGGTSVNGRLPPEVIQRIVRQNFGRFRRCYETSLQKNPNLQGRVVVTYTIARDGSPVDVRGTSPDIKDAAMVTCVKNGFVGLSYPQPEAGVVKVTYPLVFSLPEGGGAPATSPASSPTLPPTKTVLGATLDKVDADLLDRALVKGRIETRVVKRSDAGSSTLVFARELGGGVASVRIVADEAAVTAPCTESDGKMQIRVAATQPSECKRILDAALAVHPVP